MNEHLVMEPLGKYPGGLTEPQILMYWQKHKHTSSITILRAIAEKLADGTIWSLPVVIRSKDAKMTVIGERTLYFIPTQEEIDRCLKNG